MPEPSLDGCFEKCWRAQEHLALLKAEARLFGATKPYAITGKFQRRTNDYVFRVALLPSPPRLGVLIGDVVHNLRSALDLLVVQLVHANPRSGDPGIRNRFPTHHRCPRGGFHKATRNGDLRGVGRGAAAEILRLQPYRRGNGGKRNTLCVLNRLWNADKHRAIHEVRAEIIMDVGALDFEPNPDAGQILSYKCRFGARKDHAEIARVKLTPKGGNPQVKMHAKFASTIALDDGSPALEHLARMAQHVVVILRDFERFF